MSVMSVDQSRLRGGPLVLTVLIEVPFDGFGIGVVWFRWMEGFDLCNFRVLKRRVEEIEALTGGYR